MRTTALLALAAILLAGCSSTSHGTGQTNLATLCAKLGGNFTEEPDQHELYTSDQGTCGTYTMYMFAGKQQRDAWLDGARTFGGNFAVGSNWIVTNDDPAAAATARRVLGGGS